MVTERWVSRRWCDHPFMDVNTRIAFAAAEVFLRINS
jgi:prophage maintenance system killer protein